MNTSGICNEYITGNLYGNQYNLYIYICKNLKGQKSVSSA